MINSYRDTGRSATIGFIISGLEGIMFTAGPRSRHRCVEVVYYLEEETACMRCGRIKVGMIMLPPMIAGNGTYTNVSVPTSQPI